MAKALFVCFKTPTNLNYNLFSEALAERLKPDNAIVNPPYISVDDCSFSLIYNPTPTIARKDTSMCLGITEDIDQLFIPKSKLPNGSYALFRSNKKTVEIATDFASSRTIWYYNDDTTFIATTSQRMLVAFLGSLEFNEKACGWFLNSGTLGPGTSWDKRIKLLAPRTRLILERDSWQLSLLKGQEIKFENEGVDKELQQHKIDLQKTVEKSVAKLNINPSQWTLALSGGMDSRSLLFHLRDKKLHSVTWGIRASMKYKRNDARIAKRLAELCEIPHRYALMDYKEGEFPKMIERFLCAGECRIDHLAAYLDGLELWGNLSASKRGVIRGYDAFGRKPPVSTPFQVRRTNNLMITEDTRTEIPKIVSITKDDIPISLKRKDSEALEDWRDRLWLSHRTPITTAALEDIKLAYVEVINPLLSEDIVNCVQELPVVLRENKKVWEMIVSEMYPEIPFANRYAIQPVGDILRQHDVRAFICEYLSKQNNPIFFPKSFLDRLVNNYEKGNNKESFKKTLRRVIVAYLPKSIENYIRTKISPGVISNQWLALRTFMILKTHEMLISDSKLSQLLENKSSNSL